MSRKAVGFIETVGFASAIIAADTALKAASVSLVKMTSVIGVGKSIGVTVYLAGSVAAVQSAVNSASAEVSVLGTLVAAHVIAGIDAQTEAKLVSA